MSGMQLPLWEPSSSWTPTRVADLPSWANCKRIGYDVETKDTGLKKLGIGVRRPGNFMAGFSFSLEDGGDFYVPLRHQGGGNVEDTAAALRYLRDQAKAFTGELVGAHLQYDLDWSAQEGVDFSGATTRDIQVADPLIDELQLSYSLATLCTRYGIPGKDETLLRQAADEFGIDAKSDMWKLHSKFVGLYGEADSRRPLTILRKQERLLEEQGLWDIWDLESAVLPVLVKMRRRGVRVSEDRLAEVERWSREQEAEALAKVKHHTGVSIALGDVWKAGPLAEALEQLGITVPRNTKGPSIKGEWLETIDHPVAEAIRWARKTNKLRTTFAASVRTYLTNGRIHATFNQMRRTKSEEEGGETRGAAYGRLSCEDPNMQQQPSRDEFAKMWRAIYLPEEGAIFGSDDYSQQEPRWLIHFAEKLGLPKAAIAAQKYRDDPDTDNHDMMTRLIHGAKVDTWDKAYYKKTRFDCKQIFLGKCYGQGGASTCDKIHLPTRHAVFYRSRARETLYFDTREEAIACANATQGRTFRVAGVEGQVILDKFDHELPFVKKMARACEEVAKKRGYIITIGGRHCRFPIDKNGAFDWTHKSLNRLIQGSSADQTKKALVECDAAGYFIQLPVHDEICGSFKDVKEAEEMAEIMVAVYPANVPFKVDVETGTSWGESM